jgi:hypothetical protein
MNRFLKVNFLLLVFAYVMLAQVGKTTFYKFTSNTGNNHVIVIPANVTPMVRQSASATATLTPISTGDEIGVFWKNAANGQYLCVGGTTWATTGTPTTVIAWGNNSKTTNIDGFSPTNPQGGGDATIYFKIYVTKTKYEYFAQAKFTAAQGCNATSSFMDNGTSMISSLQMLNLNQNPTPEPPSPPEPPGPTNDVGDLPIPDVYTLSQNYPNPFNPTTKISYTLPKSSYVTLTIYDLNGKEIAKLLDNNVSNMGTNYVEWNGKNMKGMSASSGVYFYKIEARSMQTGKTEFLQVKSMILMK